MKNNELYGYLFTFNPYTETWLACKRDNYHELFTNQESENILKSKSVNTLIEFITKNENNNN